MFRRTSSLLPPTAGPIASKIHQLTTDAVLEFTRPDRDNLSDYIDMLERDPVSKSCAELKALRATIAIGDYEHENKFYQDWINDNFSTMEGSLRHYIGQICSAMPLGFSIAEIIFDNAVPGFYGQWRIVGLNPLDPRKCSFAGSKGRIKYVVYSDGRGPKKYIPYQKCIHVSNGFTTNFSRPYGSAECKRAYPYFKAKQVILSEMTIAAKNNATGILLGKAESNDTVVLLGSDNKPMKDYQGKPIVVPGPQSLMYQLQNLENSSVIVTDKKNDVIPIQMSAGEAFWNLALNFLNTQIMLAYGVPSLIFGGGSGDTANPALSQQHRSILDSQIESITLQIRDQIIENIIRPLLVFNFGETKDWGSFAQQTSTDPTIIASRVNNLIMCLQSGVLPSTDIDVINKLRQDLSLAPIDPERQQMLLDQQTQQQISQQMAQQQAAEAMSPVDQAAGSTAPQYP